MTNVYLYVNTLNFDIADKVGKIIQVQHKHIWEIIFNSPPSSLRGGPTPQCWLKRIVRNVPNIRKNIKSMTNKITNAILMKNATAVNSSKTSTVISGNTLISGMSWMSHALTALGGITTIVAPISQKHYYRRECQKVL